MVKEILIRLQEPCNQAKSGKPKTIDFKAVPQAIKANLVCRVSGKLGISVQCYSSL